MSLKIDIARRLKRNRPNAYADLIMIKKYIMSKLVLWPLPEYVIKYYDEPQNRSKVVYIHLVKDGKKERYLHFRLFNKKSFYYLVKKALSDRYNIYLRIDKLEKIIPEKMIIKYV